MDKITIDKEDVKDAAKVAAALAVTGVAKTAIIGGAATVAAPVVGLGAALYGGYKTLGFLKKKILG